MESNDQINVEDIIDSVFRINPDQTMFDVPVNEPNLWLIHPYDPKLVGTERILPSAWLIHKYISLFYRFY